MGAKYESKSTSGYNATPPADDNTEDASNQIFWSTIKTKLSDVLKTFAEAINTNLLTALDQSVTDTAIARTTVAADHITTINVTAGVTQSLGDAATMATGYIVTIKNSHSAAITIDLATDTDDLNGTTDGSYSLRVGEENTFRVNSSADGYLSDEDTDGTFTGVTVTEDIVIDEASDHTSTPTAGKGLIWVKDDAPSALMFTDDAGTDTYINGGESVLYTKVIDIGDWNMDADQFLTVAHGLTLANIRTITALIRNDDDDDYTVLLNGEDSSFITVDATNVWLWRTASGTFDNTDHNATSYNRGWITIQYV